RHGWRRCSLPGRAHVARHGYAGVGAKGIDVETAAAGEPRVDGQRFAMAAGDEIDEHALDAMLVESGVTAVRHEIAQQRRAIDARPTVADAERCVIRLSGDRTYGAEEIRAQHLVGEVPFGAQSCRVDF